MCRSNAGGKIPASGKYRQQVGINSDIAIRHEEKGVQGKWDGNDCGNERNPDIPRAVAGPFFHPVGYPSTEEGAGQTTRACDHAIVPADIKNRHTVNSAKEERHKVSHAVGDKGVQGAGE